MEDSDVSRRDAAADAEALRRDAWVVGTEMLTQAGEASEAMVAQAERDVLTTMGEAEREAHRLTSGARREAEDVVRGANMEAEKISNDATQRRDEIIDTANRQASAAQERTRALEQRRDELLEELENVRSTLTRLEGSLEERREVMDLTTTETTSVKVVHPPEDAKKQWELGETVRVVSPPEETPEQPDASFAEEVSHDVAAPTDLVKILPAEPKEQSEAEQDPAGQESPAVVEAEESTTDAPDDVGALFASLREGDGSQPSETSEDQPVAESDAKPVETSEPQPDPEPQVDWVAERDSLLLPITNRALRGVKKAMTEIQNVALDSLRTEESWRPDPKDIGTSVHAELVAVWTESFSAGHSVAEQMAGEKLRRPKTPASKGEKQFAKDLAIAVTASLEESGDGPRERQSAASRVFRVWRSDEAERRIRDIAVEGYEKGLEKSKPS